MENGPPASLPQPEALSRKHRRWLDAVRQLGSILTMANWRAGTAKVKSMTPDELDAKVGKILAPSDYNVLCTGPVRLLRPDGQVLAVYLPGALAAQLGEAWPVLSSIKLMTDNRGKASGTPAERRGDQKRVRTRRVLSSLVGAIDRDSASKRTGGRLGACRLTAWTGEHVPEWLAMEPLFEAINHEFRYSVPARWQRQFDVFCASPISIR